AVTEEAVALAHGLRIGADHGLPPGEGGGQHEQSRSRCMEIREEHVDGLEAIARIYEYPRASPSRPEALPFFPRRFEAAQTRGPYREHGPALGFGRHDLAGRGL